MPWFAPDHYVDPDDVPSASELADEDEQDDEEA